MNNDTKKSKLDNILNIKTDAFLKSIIYQWTKVSYTINSFHVLFQFKYFSKMYIHFYK